MNFDLFLPYETTGDNISDELRMSINRMVKYGWSGVVLTRSLSTSKQAPPSPDPLPISDASKSQINRDFGLCVLSDFEPFSQFTRFNLVTDDPTEVHNLSRNLSNTKYSLVSVTPLSDPAYKAACQTADIDIISFDVDKYLPVKSWKDLKATVSRGIFIELRYGQFLSRSESRRAIVNATRELVHATRGRNIILSIGVNDVDAIRQPIEVRSLATLLGIKNPLLITNSTAKSVISKGLARTSYSGVVRKKIPRVKPEEEEEELPIIIKEIEK